jgi:hypothetical protein
VSILRKVAPVGCESGKEARREVVNRRRHGAYEQEASIERVNVLMRFLDGIVLYGLPFLVDPHGER